MEGNERKATEKEPVLCGFVWCHGEKDFSLFEVNLSEEDRNAIEKILSKYECDGSSVRNAWDETISDMMMPEYF